MGSAKQLRMASDRLVAIRKEMKSNSVDAYIIAHTSSLRYLLNFSGSTGIAIVTSKAIHFITNDLYTVQVEKELLKLDGLHVHIDRDPSSVVKGKGLAAKWKTVGFDPSRHSVAGFAAMKKGFAPAKLVELTGVVERIMRVKSADEIKSLSAAAQLASTAYEKMLGMVRAGLTERDVATFIATTTRTLGSEKDAFDIIVVSGKRSAMPHGRASSAVLKKGDVVTVDFGCCVDGMYSDMTRTFAIGNPKRRVMDVFAVLYDAHMHALDAAVTGVKASDLDAAARDIIISAGYGEYFRHSLGHGLGYEVHEDPRVSAANSKETLPENCVVTIEPGIYLPGEFGMRIEDDVVIKAKGPLVLTTAPRELVIV